MKTITFLITLFFITTTVYSQIWSQKSNYPGSGASAQYSFQINGIGYVGLGIDSSWNNYTDFWQYDDLNDTWMSKSPFPGNARRFGVSFSIDSLGYVGLGYNGTVSFNTFYQYNPRTDVWTQLSNYPGNGGRGSFGASLNGKAYVGGGMDGSFSKSDFWVFDPTTNSWTQLTNSWPLGRRMAGVSLNLDSNVYFGLGHNLSSSFNDFWGYNPNSNTWAQLAQFPGQPRMNPVNFIFNGRIIVGGGYPLGGAQSNICYNDYYEYNPITDVWTQINSFAKGQRSVSSSLSLPSKAIIIGGFDDSFIVSNDVWEYSTFTTSIKDVSNNDHNLKLFPNPVKDYLRIELESQGSSKSFQIELFDMNGRLLFSEKLMTDFNYNLDLSSFPPSTLFYRVFNSDFNSFGTIIKE